MYRVKPRAETNKNYSAYMQSDLLLAKLFRAFEIHHEKTRYQFLLP